MCLVFTQTHRLLKCFIFSQLNFFFQCSTYQVCSELNIGYCNNVVMVERCLILFPFFLDKADKFLNAPIAFKNNNSSSFNPSVTLMHVVISEANTMFQQFVQAVWWKWIYVIIDFNYAILNVCQTCTQYLVHLHPTFLPKEEENQR